MNVVNFIEELSAQNILLWAEGEKLRYRAHKGALTPDLFSKISQHKSEILVFLQEHANALSEVYPLSHGQQALWFLYQLAPKNPAYNIMFAASLRPDLDISSLKSAFETLVLRHASLRTTFTIQDGKPIQQVHKYPIIHFKVTEATNWNRNDLNNWLDKEADYPVDLEKGPLLRLELLTQFSDQELTAAPILLLTAHHIVLDFWSIEIFMRELRGLYQAFKSGNQVSLPSLKGHYKDYVQWETDMLAGPAGEQLWAYWQKQLSGELPLLNLPTDYPRPVVQTYHGTSYSFELDDQLSSQIRDLVKATGSTLYTTLLAAFQVLLLRYTGQEDILIGSPMLGRSRTEFEEIIGYFVNPVILRADLQGNPSFHELIQRVGDTVRSALDHQDYPFGRLVEQLQTVRDPSRSPLFQVAFVLDKLYHQPSAINEPLKEPEIFITKILASEQRGAAFDLTLYVFDSGTRLNGLWQYNTALFKDTTISRMTGHFQTLLASIVANTEQHIEELPLLTQTEQQQLLVNWNKNHAEYPHDRCIHQLFEAQVEQRPDAVAVVFNEQQITYQELNVGANQLAYYLQTLGVRPDTLVGIFVERSVDMIIGLLAILKAGGAYVPLDTVYPKERVAFILKDAKVSVLLTQQPLLANLPDESNTNLSIVYLDREDPEWRTITINNQISSMAPHNLAYVIYTSGSTGQPKGVLVNHYNVVRLFSATQSWFHFNEKDVWTLFHSYAFDFSVWEIWGALCYGGTLVVVPHLTTRSPEDFYNLLCTQKVTVLNQTPSAFRQLIQVDVSLGHTNPLSLRTIIFGGEALELQSLKPWFERHGDQSPQLINMYGITETTVHVTYRLLTLADIKAGSGSVIGFSIPDLEIYILDQHRQPVPIGVPGEMYVGGDGLSRGYLNRPKLTAERFIETHFPIHSVGESVSKRLYKTGDLARYIANGDIEYLGRIDNQVKIRGFRIELGEIEKVLLSHAAVREAIVRAIPASADHSKRLVAYIVPNDAVQVPTFSELRSFLKAELPDYMVPSSFIKLEKIPLTAHGKIDFRALPTFEQVRPGIESNFVPPSTPEEEILAGIWSEVLNIEEVGIYDNFFELGGDSILSVQIIAKVKESGLDLSLQEIFQFQTIHELSLLFLNKRQHLNLSIPKTEAFCLISKADRRKLPSSIEDAYPLTLLQAGMLFHSEYSYETAVYHDIFSYHFRVYLDLSKLQIAIQQLVNRHAVLRTSFALTGFSVPLQLVHHIVEVPLSVEDLCNLSAEEQENHIELWIEAEKKRSFEWHHPPLLRFYIHKRSTETFNLTFSFHHAILDGWSVASLWTELFQYYLFQLDYQVPYIKPQPVITFRDFVALEQLTVESKKCREYWLQKLSDITVTKLPRHIKLESAADNNSVNVAISPEISRALKKLARQVSVPLKSVLLAAHLKVLSVLSNQLDVLTGLTSNGRFEENDGERVLGLFLNTLPFRMKLSGNTWIDLIRETFKVERECLPFRRYPMGEMQRLMGGQALLETSFNFVHFHVYQNLLGLERFELLGGKVFEQTNFILVVNFVLNVFSSNKELNLVLNYDTGELCEEQVKMIGAYYVRTLAIMASNPTARHEYHSLISESEKHQMLVEWNNTDTPYPQETCIHKLFEAQVEQTPEAVAVIFANQQLTYQELNIRANQLAHYLQNLGVGPDVLVGLCVERSLEMVIGILSILKAGGAYLSLDSSYPKDNLAFMLTDSQLSVLLTQEKLIARLPTHNAQVVFLDCIATNDCHFITPNSTNNPSSNVTADNLAYISYTSGSTGRPKGVCINQRSVIRLVKNTNYASFTADQIFLQFAPLAFDASTLEIWGPLLNGAKLVIMPPQTPSLEELGSIIRQHQVTTLWLTAGLFNQMVDERLEDLGSVRQLLAGGDVLSVPQVRTVLRELKECQLINGYGPTENTTFTCCFPITANQIGTSVPIGRPIANTQVYILDAYLQPVPVGVPGELHIGGDGLARGYLNRPELTAEKFILNPFSDVPNSRLYKTGDLVRYQVDGNIEFLGRLDNQVKIRGYRIELGEIETVLAQHPAVQETIVIVREYQTNDKRLMAYVILKQDVAVPSMPSDLLSFLREKLPDYMVPSALMILDTLPLTPNGKVDRNALPNPENIVAEASYVAPRTPTEEILAGLFANVLRLQQIGIHDDFFERGGHSLLATQLISRIRNTFSVELPLRQLFESPTVAGLTRRVEEARRNKLLMQMSLIQPVTREGRLSLSFAQERLWFLDQLEPGNPFYNVPAALRIKGTLDTTALEQSLAEIVKRHEVLRTTFTQVEGQPVQIIAPTFPTSPLLKIVEVSEDAVTSLAIEEFRRPFDLAKDALFRTTLLRLSETEQVWLLTMHHTVSDGWSLGVLIQELLVLYPAFTQGKPSPLPELSIQYADFAHWQRQWLTGDVLETQLAYWKQQLAGAPPVLKLPTDRLHPVVQSFRGSSETFYIDSEVTKQLKILTQGAGTTLFMTLLTAFATLLFRYSAQEDMVIGCPIANRNRAEIEPLIGFFVNTLALRIDLSANPTFIILLEQVRQVALDAYTHQDLPFEKLVDELQVERDLSYNPLFQVMFALQNAPMEQLELPGLSMVPLEIKRVAALFDIVLDMWEVDTQLVGVWEYNTDIFDAPTIVSMVKHFQTLLASIVKNPEIAISELPLLTEAEKHQLLLAGNGINKNYPLDQSLPQLITEQAEATPNRVAAIHAKQSISYAKLNERANQIAHWLRRIGIQPNDFVGILEERGIDFLVAILGVLKAGGAFLPIDPSYPADRVRYMVKDSQIHTLMTRSVWFDQLATDVEASAHLRHLFCFDDSNPHFFGNVCFFKDIEKEAVTNPSDQNEPTDIAYMLYTSGSTGLPKGTMVRHNGAVNHIYAEFDELAFHQNTAFLQSAPSSSDISVWQFLAPLLIGGRTVIVDFETVCDPVKLFKVIKSQQVTLIELVPVVMQGVLDHVASLLPEERALPDLEWAMVTGEAVSVSLVNQWLQTYPHIKLVNAYGPTEAADDICQAVIDAPLPPEQINVPIGKSIANLTLYVLDRNLKLQPIGVPGEICVSGVGVGAGYWHNEARTQASFVNNPYTDDTYGDTIYRTGDLGRWLPDGSLEFIGRLDHQVKIRGFRIELGEIEGVLSQHPAVRKTVVIDREDQPGDKRLVAYLVASMQGKGLQEQIQELHAEQVSLWQDLHEDSYSDAPSHDDPTFNIVGWDSTYTGKQLADEEMHECVDTTIAKILSLHPQKVLEIGCGTGLLMYRIVPHCENYVGTDLSSVALKRLEDSKSYVNINGMEHVTLLQKMADDFEGFETDAFDTLVMNSVVQYFPSIDYLLRVLTGAFNIVSAGGSIFIGDVRSLPLLKAYHASVQFYKADDSVTRLELEQRLRKQVVQEQELAIAPAFFIALKTHFSQIHQVDIQPKRGFIHNEMTRFRYNVILHLKGNQSQASDTRIVRQEDLCKEITWLDWQQEPLSLAEIRQRLTATQPPYLALRHVANARLQTETQILEWLANASETETVSQLRESLAVYAQPNSIDPEALWHNQDLPYDIDISYSVDRTDGSYDVIFRHRAQTANYLLPIIHYPLPTVPDWNEYANNPLQEKFTRKLLPQLRSFLKEKLPQHMVPTDFVVLETFPLMPNGKIDREALPAPDTSRNILTEGYVAPSNPVEEGLAAIWAEVLGLEQIGIHDNFFELGGHSLKATQVISRIHKDLGVEMAVRNIFNWPTIAELAPEMGTKGTTNNYFDIERVPDADHYPVSHAQQRLWVLAQMEGGSAAYHMASAVLLTGHIEPVAFDQAFSALIERHESLRTTFISVDGEPRQQVHSQIDTQMGFLDLTAAADPEKRAQELALEDASTEFDLENGPLVRMTLLKLADNQAALLFNMHHIISDGWSSEVLAREFLQFYTDFGHGKTPSLLPLRIQYRDYTIWQNNLLQSATITSHRDYWHEKLAGEIPVLNLPTDFPRPPIKTYNGKIYYNRLATTVTDLQQFSRQHNVSLFMTLVALVKVLFYRYTEQDDIIIGSPVAGRDHPDLENQIGFYVNTLVLRDKIHSERSFTDLLQQIKNTTLEAYEHQIYPFDRLVQDLNLRRDVSRSPLFDIMVVMQNIESVELSLEDVQIKPLLTEYGTSQFDLTLSFEERRDGLHTTIWYNTDLFLEERIIRLTQHLETLMVSILKDANQPIAYLNILPQSEQQLLQEFNGTTMDYSHDKSLVDLLVAQVERTPDAVAVTFEAQQLTYRELNLQANQLAHHLIKLGIGANGLVGLCVERSVDMVVGILGILKAGGAYVPLDPTYPAERLAFMLEDSQVPVLLTQQQLELGIGNWQAVIKNQIQVVYLDTMDWASQSDHDPLPIIKPENLAYVIYTSGSTGKPKGVLVTHANVVRLFSATQPWYHFNEQDVWTLFHSYAFDFSVWELWGALLYGGRLVVVPYLTSRSPEAFYDLLDQEGVTILNQTPSAFRQLIQVEASTDTAKPLKLRTIIFGGEALDIPSLRPWLKRHGDQTPQLVNMYGITETTVHVTYRPLTIADLNSPGSVIGCAIPDLSVYILDQHGQPVPIGVPGELHIGGAGLAKGYLNRPELTAEKFIHGSLTTAHDLLECRWYKTGDLARYLSSGDIEYLGRIDNQVKIRGFRIELGEIETVLTTHPAVRKAIVVAQKPTNDNRLVAYLTVTDKNTPNTNELRRFLQEKLPDYMVPATFLILEAFPLTPSGKIDIRALPTPDQTRPDMETTYVAPQSELERTLVAVWQQALGVEKIGIQDNVFDLGAHSVMIIQVRNQLREMFSQNIPVVQLFKYPTISALAEYFSQTPEAQPTMTGQIVQDRVHKREMARQRRRKHTP